MIKRENIELYQFGSCVAKLNFLGLSEAGLALEKELSMQIIQRKFETHQLMTLLRNLESMRHGEYKSIAAMKVLVGDLISELSELELCATIQNTTKSQIKLAKDELKGHLKKMKEEELK